jgi:hypothetical protein
MRRKIRTASVWTFIATVIALVAVCAVVGITGMASDQVGPRSGPGGDAVPELVADSALLSNRAMNSLTVAQGIRQGVGHQVAPRDSLTRTVWLPLVVRCCLPGPWWCPHSGQALTGKTVFALARCGDGTLFVGAEDGVYRRAPDEVQWSREVSTTGEVRGLAASSDCSAVYAAVLDQGVLRRNGGSWTLVSTPEMTGARTVVLSGGKILAGGDFGVEYSSLGPTHHWETCGAKSHLGEDIVISLVRSDGWVYVAVWCRGVLRFPEGDCLWPPGDPWEFVGLNKQCALQAVGSSIDGEPKFAGMNDRWYRWTGGHWEWCGDDRVFCIVIDGNTVYVGTEGSGVLRSTDDGVTWEPMNDGWSPPFRVRALLLHVDGDGRRWLYAGTTESVWRYLLD